MNETTTQIIARKGVSSENRGFLSKLHRYSGGLMTVQEAQKILELPKKRVAQLLPHLAASGWLKRIKRGLYLLIPIEAMSPSKWSADDWQVANCAFSPCYIGGWSAAHKWGLTDQLFNSTVVYSSHRVRSKETHLGESSFLIHTVDKAHFFGLEPIWIGKDKIMVSDPSRTIVDILDTPILGGGIRHTLEILNQYFSSGHVNEDKLFVYLEKINNRAVFKRIGFLIEKGGLSATGVFIKKCLKMVNRGDAYLDPSLPHEGMRDKRWNIMINVNIDDFAR